MAAFQDIFQDVDHTGERDLGVSERTEVIMDKVKLGIIGVGNMGTGHAKNIMAGKCPEVELTAVADLDPKRREWAKEHCPESTVIFESGDELIDSCICDAVLIAVPHYDHPMLAIRAFGKGQHVMSEKPAGVYTKQVREMNEVAEKSGLVFGMMFNQRTNAVYRKMHELVQSGQYGQIKRVNWLITNWYRAQSYYDSGSWRATWDGEGGGVLLNQCPHNLDLLQWICGLPVRVQGFAHNGKWHNIEVEDDVTAYMEFENGATGVFITSTGDAPGTNRFEVDLEKAKIVCENDTLSVYELEVNEREHCFTVKNGFKAPEGKYVEVELPEPGYGHVSVLNAFAGKILHGTPLVAEGVEGIRGLSISNAIHLSAWTGKVVSIPVDEDQFLEELNKKRATSKIKTGEAVHFDTRGSYEGAKS